MKIYLDTANIEEIKQAVQLGVISGVTTNPSLMAKETGADFKTTVQQICAMVPGPVSAEVTSMDAEGMIEEGREIATWAPNVVIKIPVCKAGLQATKALTSGGAKVNMTLIFSANQAILAAAAGATYVSPFLGRLDDIGQNGMQLVSDIVDIYNIYDIKTEIIAASIRHPMHIVEAAKTGAHIATMPYKVLMQMLDHPLTTAGIERFMQDWEKANKPR
jgi:transaldolase